MWVSVRLFGVHQGLDGSAQTYSNELQAWTHTLYHEGHVNTVKGGFPKICPQAACL